MTASEAFAPVPNASGNFCRLLRRRTAVLTAMAISCCPGPSRPNRRRMTNGQQRYRGGDCRRWRGGCCRRPAADEAGIDCLLIEARPRLGGRAWTSSDSSAFPIDLGCGWLHSADRNPWREIAEAQGCSIDKTPPPWTRLSLPIGFPLSEQVGFLEALGSFHQRLGSLREGEPDRPAATFLEPLGRWNNLINAVSTYVSGAELDRVSARDFDRYDDSGVNWRAVEGYGAVIATHAPACRSCSAVRCVGSTTAGGD